jgi:hypothetical protein
MSGPEITIGCLDAELLDAALPTGTNLDPTTALEDSLDEFASFFGEGSLGGEGREDGRRSELLLQGGDGAGPLATESGGRRDERLYGNDRDERTVFRHGYGEDFQLVRVDGLVCEEAFDGLTVKT